MRFDLKKYMDTGREPYLRQFTADFCARTFPGYSVEKPFEAAFSAKRERDNLVLHLQAEAPVSGECARCLDPVAYTAAVNVEWLVTEADLNPEAEFDLPLDEKGHLDVDEWLFQEILLDVPSVLLCSPDCLGLCPDCGKKMAECSCQVAETPAPADPRLSILKSLLN